MADNCSVKVAVRLRPLVRSEIEKGCKNILEVYKDLSQVHVKDTEKAFTFNYVLDTDASQIDLYDRCVRNVIPNLFKGYNLTILAYGQTGSGKTYSMGTSYAGDEEMGVIPRSVQQIFEFVKDNFIFDFTISVSFLELYQEVLYDLLSGKPKDQCTLEMREDPQRGIHIPGLTEVPVENAHDVYNCLIRGSNGRATASTNMNSQSSRSHAIFTMNICMQARNNTEENKTAKFHLVDLAGSERPKKTGAVGTTFREGININKGLLVLGNVISALGEEKQENRFVPYRDSNLTRLLKDSLGGNSITLMIACISPADYNIDETLSTLRYADRARKIKNKPIINQDPQTAQINELKKTVKLLQLQLIGQGGPTVSSEELILLKRESAELRVKNRDLTHKLSSALNDKAGVLGKWFSLQNSNEMLSNKIAQLKDTYNSTFNEMTIAVDSGSLDNIRDCKIKFEKIWKQFEELDLATKKVENEIKMHDTEATSFMENNNCSETQAEEINEIQETYAARQIELSDELENVMKKLAMKELLAKEMEKNVQNMVDYDNIRQNEWRIEALEKEKNELLQQLKNAQNIPNKIHEDRRRRVKELEGQIQNLMKKLNEQNRLIRLKEKDELKMRQLNQEILQMKQNRVKLVKNMKEESERFKSWKLQREKELCKLKQADVKNKYQIQKMQVMHLKQQNVLKRKVEEAVAANKRLKDAMATRKVVQEVKFGGKLEKVTTWVKQELEIVLGLTEIEVTLAALLEDRAMLQKQLDALKIDSNPNHSHIKIIEDDIELRSVQIQDMQQKLLDSDEDMKNKMNLDNIQTMAEAKQALKVLIDTAVEIKKKECSLTIRSIELETSPREDQQEKKVDGKLVEMEQKYSTSLSNLEQEYQEKIAILLRQLRGIEMKSTSDESKNLRVIIKMLQKKLEEQEKLLEEALTDARSRIENKNSQFEETDNTEYATPPKKIKLPAPSDGDAEKENYKHLAVEESPFVEIDDDTKDPDWVSTPMGKKIVIERRNISEIQKMRENMKSKIAFEDDSDGSKMPSKRSSDGGCACTKDCGKRCGCRKTEKQCKSSCKCNTFACTNRLALIEITEDNNQTVNFKRPRIIFSRD